MKKNMDSSEVDFALLLLAEKQAATSKKKMKNQQTNKQTHKCQIIVLREAISVVLRLSLD